MSATLEQLLAAISAEAPAGKSLEESGAIFELETMAKPKPLAQSFSSDPSAPPPVPDEPNWGEVLEQATSLLGQSKDLRVATIFALAAVKAEGLAGLEKGLALISGLLQARWDDLYPRLDPDDANDPTERINAINNLAAPLGTFGDPWQFILAVRQAVAFRSRQLGPVPVGTLLAAKGLATPLPGLPVIEAGMADAALRDLPTAESQSLAQLVANARTKLKEIEATFQEKAEGGQTPSLAPLHKEFVSLGSLFSPGREGVAAAAAAPGTAAAAAGSQALGPAVAPGEIRNREQVVQTLDLICAYYDRYEPASPVPFLLRRARRLVTRNFLEVMSDLAPDALAQIRIVTGTDENDKNQSQPA